MNRIEIYDSRGNLYKQIPLKPFPANRLTPFATEQRKEIVNRQVEEATKDLVHAIGYDYTVVVVFRSLMNCAHFERSQIPRKTTSVKRKASAAW